MELTQQRLKELLQYDPASGIFKWLDTRHTSIKIGSVAGSIVDKEHTNYRKITINGKGYFEHRLAWLYLYGHFPVKNIDHIDGNGTNNRQNNLRDVSASDNSRNRKRPTNNTSGTMGVHWHKARMEWRSRIKHKGKCIELGSFKDIRDAISIRKEAEIKYGYHANSGRDNNPLG